MTRNEIQKSFKRICPPRHGEKQSVWFSRLARQLGWTTERVQSLWKDDRCKLSFEEGLSLRNSRPVPGVNHPHLNELKTKLEEQDKNITRLEKILEREITFKRKLGELLAQH